MAWGKLDDGFYDNPKIVRIAKRSHGAVGLHARAISYCAKHLTDGHILADIVQGFAPLQRDRENMVKVLIEETAWYENEKGDGFILHDYLDQNPSRAEVEAKRAEDRERKRKQRAKDNG